MQKLIQYLCFWAFSIVTYESSIPTNQYFLAFFCLACTLFKSDLEIINLILDIFKYVMSGYITGYLVLSCITKINISCWPFFKLLFVGYELDFILFQVFKLCKIFPTKYL